MALSLTTDDIEKLEAIVARGVASGLSAIGLGYDDEAGKSAIRADVAWTRQQRIASEDRTRTIRRGLMSALMFTAAAIVLYLAVHLHDFGSFLSHMAGAEKVQQP